MCTARAVYNVCLDRLKNTKPVYLKAMELERLYG